MSKHQPLLHITQRGAIKWYKALLIRVLAFAAALAVCGLLCAMVTWEGGSATAGMTLPERFVVFLRDLCNAIGRIAQVVFNASFKSDRVVWKTMHSTAILLLLSLAVTPAFRMRFWNIGAEGQALMGCLASATCMILLRGSGMPGWLTILVIFLASILAGMIWAVIPAVFKATTRTNETLFTLMMNYIATQLVAFFCVVWENPKGSGQIGIINQSGEFKHFGWLPSISEIFPGVAPSFKGNNYLLNIVIVAVVCIILFFYLSRSKHGFELSVVGRSENTARYLGVKVRWITIRTMMLSGALCGLAGMLLTAGNDHTLNPTLVGGRGFTAVMVSWLAGFNPFVMVFMSFLLSFLSNGASDLATNFGLNASYSDILTGIIIFFIIGSEFFIRYRVHTRSSAESGQEVV